MDTGIVEGSTISMYYDPMISKVRNDQYTHSNNFATLLNLADNVW